MVTLHNLFLLPQHLNFFNNTAFEAVILDGSCLQRVRKGAVVIQLNENKFILLIHNVIKFYTRTGDSLSVKIRHKVSVKIKRASDFL